MMQSNLNRFKIGDVYINLDFKVKFIIVNKYENYYGIRNLKTYKYYEFRKTTIEHGNNRKYLPYILNKL